MAQPGVLQFVIVGQEDHPLFEADLTVKPADAVREVRPLPPPPFPQNPTPLLPSSPFSRNAHSTSTTLCCTLLSMP
jgi:hypothetical protein